jgi:hypothetical protein
MRVDQANGAAEVNRAHYAAASGSACPASGSV